MTARFLTVGEALTDIVVAADGSTNEFPGGSPLNVAVALGRLGHDSTLLTQIGDDERGAAIRRHLEESRVALTAGSIGERRTSTAKATLDEHGAATYDFDLEWAPSAEGAPEGVDAIHTSSIAAVLTPGADTVLQIIDAHRDTAIVSYDPNARPTLMGDPAAARTRVEQVIARADIVKSSDEDVTWMYGTDDVEDVVASWREKGPAITVLTRGGEGAIGFSGGGRVQVSPVTVTVADTVGAGDTFSAGILDALADKNLVGAEHRAELRAMPADDLAGVLRRAAKLAAITVSRSGANPPWAHELT